MSTVYIYEWTDVNDVWYVWQTLVQTIPALTTGKLVYLHRTILFNIASEGAAFYVRLCSKLFRGPEFVKMHLDAKHREEAKRIIEDKYFDCASVGETKTPPTNPTNEIPGELCGWKWLVWCC